MKKQERWRSAAISKLTAFIKTRRGTLLLLAVCAAILCSAVLLVWRPFQVSQPNVTGEARAVSITDCVVYDGIWNAKRYSDEFYYPVGIAAKDGNIIVADSMCDRIQIIDGASNKRIGKPGQYGYAYLDSGALVDGYRENAQFMKPAGVAIAPGGELIVCDTGNHVIRKIDETYVITLAGGGAAGYAEGTEGEARFNSPRAAAVDKDGVIYIADTMNHCIRRMDKDGNVTLFAGTPEAPGYADGELLQARFFEPSGLCFSPDGDLIVADAANHAIRKISNGKVSTIAGAPAEGAGGGHTQGGYADGDTSSARFNYPRDAAVLPDGSIAVADSMNHAVRLISGGTVITLAGNGVSGKYYGSVENMKLSRPEGVCIGGEYLYVSDTLNNRVVALPLTERLLAGRPSQEAMLSDTGLSTGSKYAYKGDIRVYIGGEKVGMGRVPPWNTGEHIFLPIRPLFEALGANVTLNDETEVLTISIAGKDTVLALDKDYFILKGVAVTTFDEVVRLFPYTFEWFDEFSLICVHIPEDLTEARRVWP